MSVPNIVYEELGIRNIFFLVICVLAKARSIGKGGYLLSNYRDIGEGRVSSQ